MANQSPDDEATDALWDMARDSFADEVALVVVITLSPADGFTARQVGRLRRDAAARLLADHATMLRELH